MMTSFENKCKIIADLSVEQEEEMSDIWEAFDLSTMLAYGVDRGLILKINEEAESRIEKLFDYILEYQGLEDTGFTEWDQLIGE